MLIQETLQVHAIPHRTVISKELHQIATLYKQNSHLYLTSRCKAIASESGFGDLSSSWTNIFISGINRNSQAKLTFLLEHHEVEATVSESGFGDLSSS
jgi:hypothetical protein